MDTVTIRQLTHYAGPGGNHAAGNVWACPREEALGLLAGGYAVQVESGETTAAEAPEETTAGDAPAETTAGDAPVETAERKGFPKPKAKK